MSPFLKYVSLVTENFIAVEKYVVYFDKHLGEAPLNAGKNQSKCCKTPDFLSYNSMNYRNFIVKKLFSSKHQQPALRILLPIAQNKFFLFP